MKDKKMPKQEELVLCTVDRILGTTIFVRLEKYGKEGIIPTSEIAPGRIRNIRDYVVPRKKIVCKVLRIDEAGHIDLSLRRVSSKEKRDLMDLYEKEKTALTVLKLICKERHEKICKKIEGLNIESIHDFLKNSSISQLVKAGLKKEEAEKIIKILSEKKGKEIEIKAEIKLSCMHEDGIKKISKVLKTIGKDAEIKYLSAPKYSLKLSAEDHKKANKNFEDIKEKLIREAKASHCTIEIKKRE